jgi:ribonuclease VapC
MVIDSSAIAAILFREDERKALLEKMDRTPTLYLSAATFVEIQIVLLTAELADPEQELASFLRRAQVAIVPVDEEQALLAGAAYRRFGKGRHNAGLNFGDCFSYALAKQMGEPLLFKGNDFSRTDVLLA